MAVKSPRANAETNFRKFFAAFAPSHNSVAQAAYGRLPQLNANSRLVHEATREDAPVDFKILPTLEGLRRGPYQLTFRLSVSARCRKANNSLPTRVCLPVMLP